MQIPKASTAAEKSLRVSLLVGKAYLNESYRKRLDSNFDAAADQFGLTAQEKKALRDVDWSGIVEFVDSLGTKPARLGGLKVQALSWENPAAIKRLGASVIGLAPPV